MASSEEFKALKLREMELKRMKQNEKMMKKQLKQDKKMRKREKKMAKKEAKLRRKYGAKYDEMVTKTPKKAAKEPGAKPTTMEYVPKPEEKLREAEIIPTADVYVPKSTRKLEDIQKRVDRMDHDHIESLKDRYRARFGEEIEVPDIYDTKPSIELETAEEIGDIKPVHAGEVTDQSQSIAAPDGDIGAKAKIKMASRWKKKPKEKKIKLERPVRFFDLRKPFYFRSKFTDETSGRGKKIGLLFVDIIILLVCILFFPLIILRILTTIIFVIKDYREEKFLQTMENETSQPQPVTQ